MVLFEHKSSLQGMVIVQVPEGMNEMPIGN